MPAINVRVTLIATRTIPPTTGSEETPGIPERALMIKLMKERLAEENALFPVDKDGNICEL